MAEAATKGPEKISVAMSDGRTVEFNKKQKLVKTSTVGDDGSISVRLDFVNGETRTFTPQSNMIARFAAHGIEQKLGDAIAGETDINDAVLAVDDVIGRLNNGEWSAQRASGSFAGTSVLIQALIEASGKTVDEVKAFLANKTQAEKLALRRSDKLAPIVQRIEAEKQKNSKSAVDTGALLDELGLGGPASAKSHKKAHEPA